MGLKIKQITQPEVGSQPRRCIAPWSGGDAGLTSAANGVGGREMRRWRYEWRASWVADSLRFEFTLTESGARCCDCVTSRLCVSVCLSICLSLSLCVCVCVFVCVSLSCLRVHWPLSRDDRYVDHAERCAEPFMFTALPSQDTSICLFRAHGQVRKGHKCAMSAEMAVWLRSCLCL